MDILLFCIDSLRMETNFKNMYLWFTLQKSSSVLDNSLRSINIC